MNDQQPYPSQQPGWGSPQQPYGIPPFQPQPPKKKPSAGKIVGLGCLGVFGLFVLLGAIGSAVGGGKTDTKTTAAKADATTASSSPSPSKSAPVKPVHTSAGKKPAVGKMAATKKLSTAEARKKAAAILEKEDQDFRDFLAEGEPKIGTPQFTAWYQKAVAGLDMQQNAFSKADAYFTADNEPSDLLEAWRWDNGNADGLITQFATDGTSPDAPDAKTRKDASDCLADLAKADKDAEKIANSS
ncbi:hypothetical protein ACFV2H_51725 [Streptomyces sp. NPDC059629]|uniref:hypothetical protein n=1 Tax=Streptomyces sp. NPDC059629 TaxID=3346889 RepID=UPI003696BD08